jgi:predicted component of type VI protein secretion system
LDQLFLAKSSLGSKVFRPKQQRISNAQFNEEVNKAKKGNLGIPIVIQAELDIQEANQMKRIMASPVKKATETEWKAMKVMLPITKQGVTGTRGEEVPD